MTSNARSLFEAFPDLDMIAVVDTEELGGVLLGLARFQSQNGMLMLSHIEGDLHGVANWRKPSLPPQSRMALAEAWHWLSINFLIMPAAEPNGSNGFWVFTRRGAALARGEQSFASFRSAAAFPKDMLHPAIGQKVWLALARGDLADAVFVAFRTVEEAVRAKAGYGPLDVGTALMRKAFDKANGPLADATQPEPEREALAHLFAGAIGSYKNPHSHRTVTVGDPREAQEMVLLASHLLRIVDDRTARGV